MSNKCLEKYNYKSSNSFEIMKQKILKIKYLVILVLVLIIYVLLKNYKSNETHKNRQRI